MRCDSYCPGCGEQDETVNHVILNAHQRYIHGLCFDIVVSRSVSYVECVCKSRLSVLEEERIEDPKMDMDPYPWIIWFLWKARNDKLFKGIDQHPLDLLRHAESECKAWFEENAPKEIIAIQQTNIQAPRLTNICLVNGSWNTEEHFSGFGWVWKDDLGRNQLLGLRNKENRLSSLHAEIEALAWVMEAILQHTDCQNFGTDYKEVIEMIDTPHELPNFLTDIGEVLALKNRFQDFKICQFLDSSIMQLMTLLG